MKKEFITERQGRNFVLFAGLLDEAHAQGLKRVCTKLLQVPSKENQDVAITWAEVETSKGVFTGIGDASPTNVGRNIVPHIIRMSETRAVARALRLAVNVGAAALEELAEDEEHPVPSKPAATPATKPNPSGQSQSGGPSLRELVKDCMKANLLTQDEVIGWCKQAGVEKLEHLPADSQENLRHRLADLLAGAIP